MADKLRTQQQLEQLQARYVGTGHADTTKFEWTSNVHRDSLASYIGHPPMLSYMAIGLGEPKEKVRAMLIEKMVHPVGNPPETEDLIRDPIIKQVTELATLGGMLLANTIAKFLKHISQRKLDY